MSTSPSFDAHRSGPGPRRLPPYSALLAVDVRDFSGYEGGDHAELTARIRPIVKAAFRRCNLSETWDEEVWHRVIGDSYVAAFPSRSLPMLLNPLLRALQDQLETENREAPIGRPARPIRMRVSIHVGPVTEPYSDEPSTDGSGTARVEIHRLLDASEVKELLTRSGDETCVAAIVSGRVYDDVVASGFVGEPTAFYRPVEVAVKKYRGLAYLRVPSPSGGLLDHGFGVAATANAETEGPQTHVDAESAAAASVVGGVAGDAVQAGTYNDHRVTGVGSVGRDAHNVITGTQGEVNISNDNSAARKGRARRSRRDG